jgi:hypothetical protein
MKQMQQKSKIYNIDQLSLCVYVSHLNVPLFDMISQEVMSSLNMSHLFVED